MTAMMMVKEVRGALECPPIPLMTSTPCLATLTTAMTHYGVIAGAVGWADPGGRAAKERLGLLVR